MTLTKYTRCTRKMSERPREVASMVRIMFMGRVQVWRNLFERDLFKRDLHKRDLQERLARETCERDLQERLARESRL